MSKSDRSQERSAFELAKASLTRDWKSTEHHESASRQELQVALQEQSALTLELSAAAGRLSDEQSKQDDVYLIQTPRN